MPSDALLAASGSGRQCQQSCLLGLHARETACGKMMAFQHTVSYSRQQQAGRVNIGSGSVAGSQASGLQLAEQVGLSTRLEAMLTGCSRQQQARQMGLNQMSLTR